MNHYELVLILSPVLSEEEVRKTVDRYKDMVSSAGGEIVHEEPWGLRQLAYPIRKKTTGIYHVVEYTATGGVNTDLETQFKRDDVVMRLLITRLDKYAVEYNEKRRRGEIGKKKKKKKETQEPGAEPVAEQTRS